MAPLHRTDPEDPALALDAPDAPAPDLAEAPAPGAATAHARSGRCVLRADAAVVPLATTLASLHEGGCTGRLDFAYADHHKVVWLRRGEVVFATSNVDVDRLGECLIRAGLLRMEQLEHAERVHRPPARFGRSLVECGYLTPRQLWNAVRHQVEEIVRSLFCYPGGELAFRVDVAESDNVVRLALETDRLIAEGLQRRVELQRFQTLLRDPRARLVRGPAFRGGLAREEHRIVEVVGEGVHFGDLVRALGLHEEAVARSIQLLRLVGAVRLVRGDEADADAGAPAPGDFEARVDARIESLVALAAGLAAVDAKGADPDDAVREILEQALDDVARGRPALGALSLAEAGGLAAWARRAHALVGSAEPVEEALAELASYLVFEIRNHPGISDPEALVRGGLR